ncbi:MAG: GntR family transcriptional regulator [Mangrovicoccus sp.]|nr:GntR family transcriptional regulator [Mangrovicoccus sp.]
MPYAAGRHVFLEYFDNISSAGLSVCILRKISRLIRAIVVVMEIKMVKRPVHAEVYEQIKSLILFGDYLPGHAVTIHGVSNRLGVGITPIRESMRRLNAEGALVSHENRRVSVPKMDDQRLKDIQLLRETVEPELAKRAAPRGDEDTRAELARLAHGGARASAAQDHREFLEWDYRFHFALYELAQAPVLERLARSLWLQLGPAMRAAVQHSGGTKGLAAQNQALLLVFAAGDADAIGAEMARNIAQRTALLSQSIAVA